MNIQEVAKQLHPLERAILPYLHDQATTEELIQKSNLKDIEITRALQWLENKEILKRTKTTKTYITLGDNGKHYLEQGLPEKKLLEEIQEGKTLLTLKDTTTLNNEEFAAALGSLKQQQAINIIQGKIEPTDKGKQLLQEGLPEEQFLKTLPQIKEQTNQELLKKLQQRKGLLETEEQTTITIQLTDLGTALTKAKLDFELIEAVTPAIIRQNNWKEFRTYDLTAPVPAITGGKRHFTNHAISYIRNIWKNLGFQEMTGTKTQTSFWNFDALFTPQNHPARELQDTYYIKEPAQGTLPNFWKTIKETHENGGTTGSKGWGGTWNQKEAQQNSLRPHTTCLSVQTLRKIKEEKLPLPAKYFSVGKVFRNETLDWKHLFEFYQTEGIVIDENANFQHLLGYLRTFFKAMGFQKARFRPGPFPYTEPSVEIDVWHPERKTWVELGGAGIFRPEVVEPLLGKFVPVLAWGLGLDRLIVNYYDIKDLRDMYGNDIKDLREKKLWIQ
ncbi:MAG: phenylalanine--tRNA ligase subunit alpha [Nanoarchaeota archaeon]|nr:phenylalanine--tRNA ligase subunit alpha [Nanoarchaeota archaeon]